MLVTNSAPNTQLLSFMDIQAPQLHQRQVPFLAFVNSKEHEKWKKYAFFCAGFAQPALETRLASSSFKTPTGKKNPRPTAAHPGALGCT